jgi:hypothetical protein
MRGIDTSVSGSSAKLRSAARSLPAGADQRPDVRQHALGLSDVREQKPRVGDVERAAVGTPRIADEEFDVLGGGLLRVAACQLDDPGIEVDPQRAPARADEPSQVERDMSAAAADVEAALTVPDPDLLEQPQRRRPHDPGQKVQPALAALAPGDRVRLAL